MTPEGTVQKAIIEYLKLCRLGTVRRANVGVARMGEKPNHPWAKDNRRVVRFGEKGESDLRLELANDTRTVFIEVKAPGWNAPSHPKPGAAASTWEKFQHHQDQVAFQARQIARGHIAFFARSVVEVYTRLSEAGFPGLPTPQEPRRPRTAPPVRARRSKSILEAL